LGEIIKKPKQNNQKWLRLSMPEGESFYNIITMFDIHKYALCHKAQPFFFRGCPGRDRMVVGFTTTYAISAYHH
jgi:hypothetical protein